MKIGVWLNDNINPNTGGGFSYTERLVELIDKKKFSKPLEIVFITNLEEKLPFQKDVFYLKTSKIRQLNTIQRIIRKLSKRFSFLKTIHKKNVNARTDLIQSEIRYHLEKHGIDIIYYLVQQEKQLRDFPFISTNWDLGHLSMKPFPEVIDNGEFELREKWYRQDIKEAVSIFSDSEAGKQELIKHLNLDANRIMVLPIFPGKVINLEVGKEKQKSTLANFGLTHQNYFFYPAQFWEHKNHLNLVKAFKIFSLKHTNIKLVFTGSDKGNLPKIKALVKKENLEALVTYLGFVDLDEINTLYKNAIALVMPTFLGPTNMPPMEARSLGCPVLCSDFKGHREQLGEAALYFNPESIEEISNALIDIMDDNTREQLLEKAKIADENSIFNGEKAIEILEQNLLEVCKLKNSLN